MRRSEVRHDTLTAPADLHRDEVRALAERQAHSQVTADEVVSFVHLHGSQPADSVGAEKIWRFSYHVTTRDDTPAD
ncbi:hypothetical protein ACGFK1_28080 [Mycobacterium sp. NPDC048908]|uniref:hypothetical protein n=1 Tax=Mycobacterium sp. NPDC048908 TaxID=3364292 RepID=UPI00371E6A31